MYQYAQRVDGDHSEMSARSRRRLMGPVGCCSANQRTAKGQFLNKVRFLIFFNLSFVSESEQLSLSARASKVRVLPLGRLRIELTFDLDYWINLGKLTAFRGHILLDCLSRIHLDIIEAWTFYDPEKLLSGSYFRENMIKLIEPLLTEPQPGGIGETLSTLSTLSSIAGVVAASFAQVLSGAGIAVVAVKFLSQKYQEIPLTARCLGAYIVDLTLILHNLFIAILVKEPPRPLNRELITDTLRSYQDSHAGKIHRLISDIASGTRALDPKEKIADLIRQELDMDKE
ncbi:hypothetical protein EDB83DRAFT_1738881 [Lactarius deliciosus]|nr:hypothetical protein EDB83DRAFT_1738881 [Lactarius deliciosus]